MFLDFFYLLKQYRIPVTLKEYLSLLEAVQGGLPKLSVDKFYALCKTTLIKHEQYYDRFDQLFGHYFKGMDKVELADPLKRMFNEDWIKKNFDRVFSQADKDMIKAMGGLDKVMEQFKKILEEQKERHEGGSKWVGTGGISPFGNSGYNPEGIRVGGESTQGKAIKIWEKREYKDLSSDVELNTRSIKLALKKLRNWAREGAEEELDLDNTIKKTAENAGLLNIEMVPSTKNNVKVLLFFDVGGSMDYHIDLCSRLFSAATTEFKQMEYFYFHNCFYDQVWKDNALRYGEETDMYDIFNEYNANYKVIIVGDAYMSPYEIISEGGAIDFNNKESGATWIQRLTEHFPHTVWLNPMGKEYWNSSQSIQMVKELMKDRMYELTIGGIGEAINNLMSSRVKTV